MVRTLETQGVKHNTKHITQHGMRTQAVPIMSKGKGRLVGAPASNAEAGSRLANSAAMAAQGKTPDIGI